MPDGKISIKIDFDNRDAVKSTDDLMKSTQRALDSLKKQTKLFKIDFDVSSAKANIKGLQQEIVQNEKNINAAKAAYEKSISGQIKNLERDIANANKAYQKLQEGDLGDYARESDSALQLLQLQKARAKSQIDLNAAEALYNQKMDELEAKYSKVLLKADTLRSNIQELGQQKVNLETNPQSTPEFKTYQEKKTGYDDNINEAKKGISEIAEETEKVGSKATKLFKHFKTLHSITSGIKTVLKTAFKPINLAYSATNKLVKTVGKNLVSGIKKAASNFLHIGKNADSVHKKILKIGTALLGMKGLMGALRQIVSSAFNNDEKLQKTLEATKGVLGEAITPIITVIVDGLSKMVTLADRLYQIFTGTSLIAKYNAKQAQKNADSTADAAKSAKEYKNQLAGFDSINKLEDNTASDSDKTEDTNSSFTAVPLSDSMLSLLDKLKSEFNAGNFEGMGEALAAGLNGVIQKVNSLDWKGIQNKVNGFSTGLAQAVNGFTKDFDWTGAGTLLSNGLNTITGAVSTFVDNTKWDSIGAGVSTSLNSFVNNIDTDSLGKTLTAKLKIITDTLYGFFNGDGEKKGFDFKNFGKKIGETINSGLKNIDFKKLASNITSAISGLGETIYGAVTEINWNDGNDSVVSKIEDFIKGLDWKKAFTNIFKALGAILGGMGSVLIQLIKDAWDNIYDTYFAPAIDEAGGNVIEGIFNGIKNWLKDVGKWIYDNILSPFIDGFKETFNIHSPSQNPQIVDLGKNIIEGAFNGIIEWLKNIKTWFKENVFDKIIDAWNGMKELTISIGGKLQDSFNSAKQSWEDFKSKTETLTAEAKEGVNNAFSNLKDKWDSFVTKSETLTAQAKEDVKSSFSNLKSEWDSFVTKSETLTAKAKEDVKSTFSNLKGKWDSFVTKAETLTAEAKEDPKKTFSDLKTKWDNWKNKAVDFTVNTLTEAFEKFKKAWDDLKDKTINLFAKITGSDDSGNSTSVGGTQKKSILSSIFGSLFGIKLASGGIVNSPPRGVPAVVGEGGAEAVLPLENNTEWMDALAQKTAEVVLSNFSGMTIINQMDSKTLSKEFISINNRRRLSKNGGNF